MAGLADALGDAGLQPARWVGAAAAAAVGDWSLAHRYIDQHLAHYQSVGVAVMRALLDLVTGDAVQARQRMAAIDTAQEGPVIAWRLVAFGKLLVHRVVAADALLDEARELLARADHLLAAHPPRPRDRGFWEPHLSALLCIAADTGPADAAREYASFISAEVPPFVVPCLTLSTERVAGLLAAATGDRQAAVAHLDRAATAVGRPGTVPSWRGRCSISPGCWLSVLAAAIASVPSAHWLKQNVSPPSWAWRRSLA